MLLLYILWDDWPIFMISALNEQLQQQSEYTLQKPDCHSWWISKIQFGCEEERYTITLCFKLGKMQQKRMECFRLLLDHLTWIEHQFLSGIKKIQPRMMAATFNGNPRATIISCYSPTNVSEETELVTFYDELSSLVRSIPKHNMLVIGGDMNAQIGKNGNNKYSLHNTSNRNGQHLTDFMIKNRLACLNTNYQKREGKLWTYTYANNTKAQIDYVLINKKWKNSAMNCEAYSSFEGVSTDHRIVTAKIRLSLRKNAKRTATTKRYDWALLNNKDVRDKYVLELRNRFETLQEKTEKSTPNDEYENFVNAHLVAAAKCIPTKLKTKYRVPWETLAVREKRALVKTASKNYRKNPTNTNALKLKTAQYQLAGIYIKEQTEYIQNQIDKIRDSVEDRQSRIAGRWTIGRSGERGSGISVLPARYDDDDDKRFKEGRESVRDDERCGRSKKVNTPELIGQRVRVRVTMLSF